MNQHDAKHISAVQEAGLARSQASMTSACAHQLERMTSAFYAQQNQSFSQTRQAPWPGWERCLSYLGSSDEPSSVSSQDSSEKPKLLDVACGNLRFERFMDAHSSISYDYYAVDNCKALAQSDPDLFSRLTRFIELDLIDSALNSRLAQDLSAPLSDALACFGFMHHVPGVQTRLYVLDALIDQIKPSGYGMFSFWQFMKSPKLAQKAVFSTQQALGGSASGEYRSSSLGLDAALRCAEFELKASDLEKNDYVLGWQEQAQTWRYCHHFDETEIDAYVQHIAPCARAAQRFAADGATGNLNTYLVVQKL